MKAKHPIQPLVRDAHGVIRFKENPLVRALLDHGQRTGFGLNELAVQSETCVTKDELRADWQQLAQLIGYSLSGYGELSYVDDAAWVDAYAMKNALT